MFTTEKALCESFAEHDRHMGWVVYNEQGGWDMLLVKDQWQIGIQAKLRSNIKVVRQALPTNACLCPGLNLYANGPDFRAVLVPDKNPDFRDVCAGLHLVCLCPDVDKYTGDIHWIDLGLLSLLRGSDGFRWQPKEKVWLPDILPEHAGGVPSPLTVSEWKQGALRAMAHLAIHGHITTETIRKFGCDPRRFVANDWIREAGYKIGKLCAYKEGNRLWMFLNKNQSSYLQYLAAMKGDVTVPVAKQPDLVPDSPGL